MRIFFIKRITVLLLCFSAIVQARWISLNEQGQQEKPDIMLLSSNEFSMSFSLFITGIEVTEIDTKEMIDTRNEGFILLSLSEEYHTGEIGRPKLPAIRKTIGVPYGAQLEIVIVRSDYEDIPLQALDIEKRIMPVLESVVKLPGEKPVFVIDEKTYSHNALYPQEIVQVVSDDIMRGHRLAIIEIVPIQYNPVTQVIRYYKNIEVRVTFSGGDIQKTQERILRDYSPPYEDFIKQRVLNYTLYEHFLRDVVPLPIHYLIITHNNFHSEVNNLAQWLTKKGFNVKVANQDSINPWTTSTIEHYIDAQSPAPTYLLLVGDVNGGYMPAPIGSSSGKVTDLYYAELDGTGYLPDIFYGRLSCETTTHISTMVNKIINYETANLPDPVTWFKKDAFCAGNDNYIITEGTHNHCTSTFMNPHGYTTYKLYEQTYGATSADVTNNVNDGRILITMSGHGSDDGWHDGPLFVVYHVNALSNGNKLTIATGHCCLANNFGSSINPCGGESWVRKENGGAVAYYGSCPYTYWDEDDWLEREWYEAIYADSIYEHARFTLDGMYDGVELSGSWSKQYYYEAYHVLGDPSLDIWTDVPQSMIVTHDVVVFPGDTSYTVSVQKDGTPLNEALVCCWIPTQSPDMHVVGYTDAAGVISLDVSPTTTPGDTMFVTVTKHNYIPYEGYALVTAASGPYITLGTTIIDDAGGNGQVNPGEAIDLGVWAKNVGFDTAFSVYGLLSTSDSYTTITIDSSEYGDIAPDDSLLSDPYYSFSIANDCPNNHGIGLTSCFMMTMLTPGRAIPR
jgi:hypothetical protein